jgi:hypothetical protein
MNKVLASGVLIGLLAGQAQAQPGVTYAPQAYPTAGEAMQHLLPPPPACVGHDGDALCDPTFSQEVGPGGVILWRPTTWVAKGSKGMCSDETGHAWSDCDGTSPGRYRIRVVIPPPPPLILSRPNTSAGAAPPRQPRTYYDTAEEAKAHLQPAPADCLGDAGKPLCVPTFSLTMNEAGKVFWRPAGWQRADPPGACVDATGHDWSSCGAPPPGRYRFHISPPPAAPLEVPAPPPLMLRPVPTPQGS